MITEHNPHIAAGNKAENLFAIRTVGCDVPLFCVITFSELNELLLQQGYTYTEAGVGSVQIPDEWVHAIQQYLAPATSYAVRSSTGVEDGLLASYAGQFATKLNVPELSLKAAIKDVWLSPFGAHVGVYEAHVSKRQTIPISIIIQQCIDADVSGVVFSKDPLDAEAGTVVVNSLYGLGEGLVSGQLEGDMFWMKDNVLTKQMIADKTEKLVYQKEGGLQKVSVSEKEIQQASVTTGQLKQLAVTAQSLENYFGQAQDIEFCLKDNRLYILQSRPVTALMKSSKDYLVWDNSNIIESYSGITLPLTFSFISPVYAAVYKQFSSILGIDQKTINENEYTFNNMLGLLKGRVYYNLYSWYKLLSLLPGYSLNAGFMEKMMGVTERFELKGYKKPNGIVEKIRVGKLFLSMFWNAFRLPALRRKFVTHFNEVIHAHKKLNIQQADAFSCMHAYYRFEHTLAKEWKAPLLNDFFAMIWYGLFEKFVARHFTEAERNHNQYFICSGQVITTQPARLQQKIAACIQADPQCTAMFLNSEEEVIWQWIQSHPDHEIARLCRQYLETWGDRCFSELKLETVTYSQNPLLFIRILKQTFESPQDMQPVITRDMPPIRLGFFKNTVFHFLRRNAISTVSARENLRFERTRAFAEVRTIFLRIGELFHNEHIIEEARDIFYLSKEEIFNYIKGSSIQLELKPLIALRKNEFLKYLQEPEQAARIKTYDIVYKTVFPSEGMSDIALLKGIPCCPGLVRAEVRIIHSPDDIVHLDGKILVTVSTDPGWVSVFPLVKGILVQRGSVLSHAAIVSREMNIPCIVGVKNITSLLKNGMVVEMNGMTGEIKIIA